MEYLYPNLLADHELKRLHIETFTGPNTKELREKCDIGNTTLSLPFMAAVRLINEEGYRPCGNCLEEGGEVSNWKERAETAESNIRGLNSQVEQAEKLTADWKERADEAERRLAEAEAQLASKGEAS